MYYFVLYCKNERNTSTHMRAWCGTAVSVLRQLTAFSNQHVFPLLPSLQRQNPLEPAYGKSSVITPDTHTQTVTQTDTHTHTHTHNLGQLVSIRPSGVLILGWYAGAPA